MKSRSLELFELSSINNSKLNNTRNKSKLKINLDLNNKTKQNLTNSNYVNTLNRSKDFEYSLNSNNSEFIKLLKNSNSNPTLDFGEYGDLIRQTMSKYLDSNRYDEEENTKLDYEDEQSIRNNMKTCRSKLYNAVSEENLLRVVIKSLDYKNPFESFKILRKNKKVFEEISRVFLERQKHKYIEEIDKINHLHMKYNAKMPNLRITAVDPKKRQDDHIDEVNKKINQINDRLPHLHIANEGKSNNAQADKLQKMLNNEKTVKLYSYYLYSSKNFPEGREQFCFFSNNTDIILFGGIVSNKNNQVWSLNPDDLEWNKFNSENIAPNPRFGHTGVVYQKKLYAFGGKSKTHNYTFLADLDVFNLEDHSWSSPLLYTKNFLALRKNHVGDLIGHHMIIHGGINENGEYLNDTFLLNFTPAKWYACSINDEVNAPTLAGHACTLVLPSEIKFNPRTSIYKFPDVAIGRAGTNVQ